MQKLFRIHLAQSERGELESLVRAKNVAKAKQLRAHILLLADEDRPGGAMRDFDIAAALCCGSATVGRTRQDLCEHGLPGALERAKSQRVYAQKLDGAAEAKLVAACCGPPPAGQRRWTLQLLADHLVELKVVESVSYETVRQRLAANELKPWLKKQWCIPPLGQRRVRQRDGGRARRLPPAP